VVGARSCPVTVVWDDRFLDYDFGGGHPFTEASRGLAVELLELAGFFDRPERRRMDAVAAASRSTVERFHTASYLDRLHRVSGGVRRTLLDAGDTPGFPGCWEASARIVAGTVAGAAEVLSAPGRHALQPAGGLHHAHPGSASGFCILNDVAVTLRDAFDARAIRRAAYIDIDAHHGDGVMYGFYDDGRLLDIDVHQDGRTLFPGTGDVAETGRGDGAGLKVNVPLPPGAGDEELLRLFYALVPELLRAHRPELIVLQHGLDGHLGDPLAQLQYTPRAYVAVLERLHLLAHEVCDGRLLVTGGGGYRPESVSRGLARIPYVLAGGAPPAPSTALPPAWLGRFEARLGVPPPSTWGEGPAPRPGASAERTSSAILDALESYLGRRFERPGPDGIA
jgi:acetoin utilization protein AcuC